jgi:CopA family copper-resistance protein
MLYETVSRRQLLERAGALGLGAVMARFLPIYAWAGGGAALAQTARAGTTTMDLTIRDLDVVFAGRRGHGMSINGTIPGPLIRLREGGDAILRVSNALNETTSIHWHGLILPPEMDGVPGVSFAGIKPRETFEYRFPVRQYGTYWYHSHSGGQEQMGVYGPLIIDPAEPEPFKYDRDYVVMLSDWSFTHPMELLDKLKARSNYFNYQRRTVGDFVSDVARNGLGPTVEERLMWMQMRMDPTDLLYITCATYTYLMNGQDPMGNWTGLFRRGERVRLRFIGAGAMTIFDVRIPGLKLHVVHVDGQHVKPVAVDEFRISPGETYDVIVEPTEDRAYTVFAETLDRSGFAMGTLAPRAGMRGPMPERRKRAIRSMADMGMAHGGMSGMDHGGHNMPSAAPGASPMPGMDHSASPMPGMDHGPSPTPGMDHGGHAMPGMDHGRHAMPSTNQRPSPRPSPGAPATTSPIPGSTPVPHGPDHHGPANSMVAMESRNRFHEPGTGLGDDGRRVLVYTDLQAPRPWEDQRPPEREIKLHLTGNMERFMWSIDGKKYSEAPDPILFRQGERLRLTMVNDTMMEHPMHLHGMWMYLENGHGAYLPRKHTFIVKPGERASVLITADAPVGPWAFHCHMLFHMEMGMFRVVRVVPGNQEVRS